MHPLAFSLIVVASLAAEPKSYQSAHAQAIEQGKPILVLVGADWCPGCRTLKHQTLSRMLQTGKLADVEYAVVDADRESRLARQLMRGNSIPQLILFTREGEQWHRGQLTGAQPESTIASFIKQSLADHSPARPMSDANVTQASGATESASGR
jgi:thioredoxin-like negative regulator of GroEL